MLKWIEPPTDIYFWPTRSPVNKITNTTQKMKFSIKDFISKCDQIRKKLKNSEEFLNGKLYLLCSESSNIDLFTMGYGIFYGIDYIRATTPNIVKLPISMKLNFVLSEKFHNFYRYNPLIGNFSCHIKTLLIKDINYQKHCFFTYLLASQEFSGK